MSLWRYEIIIHIREKKMKWKNTEYLIGSKHSFVVISKYVVSLVVLRHREERKRRPYNSDLYYYYSSSSSVAWVRERTIPTTERQLLVGEVSAKFCGLIDLKLFLESWLLIQFLNTRHTRLDSLNGNQLFARPLPTHRTTQTQNKQTYKLSCLEWDLNPLPQYPSCLIQFMRRPHGDCAHHNSDLWM
jgi:hypothetical protein